MEMSSIGLIILSVYMFIMGVIVGRSMKEKTLERDNRLFEAIKELEESLRIETNKEELKKATEKMYNLKVTRNKNSQ